MFRRFSLGVSLLGIAVLFRILFVYNGSASILRSRAVDIRDTCHGTVYFNNTYQLVEPVMSNSSTLPNFSTNCSAPSGCQFNVPPEAPMNATTIQGTQDAVDSIYQDLHDRFLVTLAAQTPSTLQYALTLRCLNNAKCGVVRTYRHYHVVGYSISTNPCPKSYSVPANQSIEVYYPDIDSTNRGYSTYVAYQTCSLTGVITSPNGKTVLLDACP